MNALTFFLLGLIIRLAFKDAISAIYRRKAELREHSVRRCGKKEVRK